MKESKSAEEILSIYIDPHWQVKNCVEEIVLAMQEYASLQKQQSDEAFEMHKLHMLINVLDEFGIKATWLGEYWAMDLPESNARNEAIQEAVDICYRMRDCNPANIAKTISKLKTP